MGGRKGCVEAAEEHRAAREMEFKGEEDGRGDVQKGRLEIAEMED